MESTAASPMSTRRWSKKPWLDPFLPADASGNLTLVLVGWVIERLTEPSHFEAAGDLLLSQKRLACVAFDIARFEPAAEQLVLHVSRNNAVPGISKEASTGAVMVTGAAADPVNDGSQQLGSVTNVCVRANTQNH